MIHACELCKYKDRCVDRPTSNVADCNVFVMQAPQTNADRIRSMSDEELAEYLSELIRNASDYITGEGNWLQWLKSEAKE